MNPVFRADPNHRGRQMLGMRYECVILTVCMAASGEYVRISVEKHVSDS